MAVKVVVLLPEKMFAFAETELHGEKPPEVLLEKPGKYPPDIVQVEHVAALLQLLNEVEYDV